MSRAVALLLACAGASAQDTDPPYCASDGQPRPVALIERFISADCERCWQDPAAPRAGRRELAVDWIVPGRQGEDAPLSAAASRDAPLRLAALRRPAPAGLDSVRRTLPPAAGRTLRVAHGLPLADYVAASIEMKPGLNRPNPRRWTAWLLLVETLPAGTEGSPVERNLVRNSHSPAWINDGVLSKDERRQLARRVFDSRPMRIPENVRPERLRVIGWVEDAQGRVVAAAQSRCVPVR